MHPTRRRGGDRAPQKRFLSNDDEGRPGKDRTRFKPLYDRNMILAEMKQIEQTKQPVIKTIVGDTSPTK